jgi:outer membrane protein TolC
MAFTAFNKDRSAAAAAQARAQADAVRAQLADAERRVRLEVTQRALELATASAAVQVAGRALEAAQENARVAGDRYREGVSSSSDLLDAETVLLRAGLERTSAATGLRVALANLERATGR